MLQIYVLIWLFRPPTEKLEHILLLVILRKTCARFFKNKLFFEIFNFIDKGELWLVKTCRKIQFSFDTNNFQRVHACAGGTPNKVAALRMKICVESRWFYDYDWVHLALIFSSVFFSEAAWQNLFPSVTVPKTLENFVKNTGVRPSYLQKLNDTACFPWKFEINVSRNTFDWLLYHSCFIYYYFKSHAELLFHVRVLNFVQL